MDEYEHSLIFNDTQIPFQNDKALELTLQVGDVLSPDIIFLNGDMMDMWQISKFVKKQKLIPVANLAAEIEQGREFFKKLRKRFLKSRIVYIFGNHEWRFDVYIGTQAPELHGLRGTTLAEQLDLKEQGIEVVYSGNKESSYLYGKLLIGHFDAVNKDSAVTAKNLLENKSISGIQAHTHRGGSCFKRAYDRDLVFYENFCLCSRFPEYVDRPNWQLGFSIIHKDKKSDFFYVEQHPITEFRYGNKVTYKTWFKGRVYQT